LIFDPALDEKGSDIDSFISANATAEKNYVAKNWNVCLTRFIGYIK
jgi:hypothetical protein